MSSSSDSGSGEDPGTDPLERPMIEASDSLVRTVTKVSEDVAEIVEHVVLFLERIQEFMEDDEEDEDLTTTLYRSDVKRVRLYLRTSKLLLKRVVIPKLEEQDFT